MYSAKGKHCMKRHVDTSVGMYHHNSAAYINTFLWTVFPIYLSKSVRNIYVRFYYSTTKVKTTFSFQIWLRKYTLYFLILTVIYVSRRGGSLQNTCFLSATVCWPLYLFGPQSGSTFECSVLWYFFLSMASNIIQYKIISWVSSWRGYTLVKMTAGENIVCFSAPKRALYIR